MPGVGDGGLRDVEFAEALELCDVPETCFVRFVPRRLSLVVESFLNATSSLIQTRSPSSPMMSRHTRFFTLIR